MKKRKRQKEGFKAKFSPEVVYYTTQEEKKNRLYFLMLKGICFSIMSYGLLGGFLSAMDLQFRSGLVLAIFLLTGAFLGSMYITPMMRDVGYVLFFGSFVNFSIKYKEYINSGFYAVVNEVNQEFIAYFALPGGNEYSETFSNRYLTVTYMIVFLGIIDLMLMNIAALSGIRLFSFILQCVFIWAIPVYLGKTPQMFYVILTMAAFLSLTILKFGEHSKTTELKWKDKEYKYHYIGKMKTSVGRREAIFDYKNSYQVVASVLVFSFVLSMCCIGIVVSFLPKNSWNSLPKSQFRKDMDQGIYQVFRYGLDGSFFGSSAGGGIGKGKLGGNSSVRPSYETHLRVTFAPYSLERLYLRAYTGVIYKGNQWQEYDYGQSTSEGSEYSWRVREELLYREGVGRAEAYGQKSEDSKTAKAKMIVQNVNAEEEFLYTPYYTNLKEEEYKREGGKTFFPRSTSYVYEYYPLQSLSLKDSTEAYNVNQVGEKDSVFVEDCYLQIPKENQDVIEEICEDMNLTGNLQKKINTIQQYFQDNYPYTTRPGKVPKGKDAINYFLKENKKGYCAYYASAATLLFRNMGIPARYVEGYAIDYTQFAEADFVSEAEYSDFYSGYSTLGETGVVQVDVSDACAHAWVEIYLKDFGWFPVEVTPADTEEEEDFWTLFGNIFQQENNDLEGITGQENENRMVSLNSHFLVIFLVGIFVITGSIVLHPKLKSYLSTHGKNSRDNLYAQYHLMWEMTKKVNSEEDLTAHLTYQEQLGYLSDKYPDIITKERGRELTEILERIGFSQKKFSEEEIKQVQEEVRKIKENLRKQGRKKKG